MKHRTILIIVFVLVALLQLYIPARMIWDRENILANGVEYRFRTAPIDPNDPFRGKYIILHYDQTSIEVEKEDDWNDDETVFVVLSRDTDGFATIKSVSKSEPDNNADYVEATVRHISGNGANILTVDYPFDRFYMEESKAPEAEQVYRDVQRDTSYVTYALVRIKNGEAVLQDVLINGASIKEIVKTNLEDKDN